MALFLSSSVREKLAGKMPPVSNEEILQCFANRSGRYLVDPREQHRTDPPTRWFLAETDYGRLLMNTNGSIAGAEDAWDNRELGSDPNFAVLLDTSDEVAIDDALALQPISIRLQKSLIEDFKLIAQLNGLGYQTLMRQVLTRFADCEKKRILREAASAAAARSLERSIGADGNPPKTASGA